MVRLQVLAVIGFFFLLIGAAPAQAASGEGGIYYTRVVVEPAGPDFQVTVYYNVSFMTKVFSILFGTGSLQAAITDEVSGFDAIELESLNTADGVARFTASNQSAYADGWYMYDHNAGFPVPVDTLEISGPALSRPIVISNATEVPDFFYQ